MRRGIQLASYAFPLSVNIVLLLWAWLGVNQGKGLFYFTIDELGLDLLSWAVLLLNVLFWIAVKLSTNQQWASGFGRLALLMLLVCIALEVHAYITGISS